MVLPRRTLARASTRFVAFRARRREPPADPAEKEGPILPPNERISPSREASLAARPVRLLSNACERRERRVISRCKSTMDKLASPARARRERFAMFGVLNDDGCASQSTPPHRDRKTLRSINQNHGIVPCPNGEF